MLIALGSSLFFKLFSEVLIYFCNHQVAYFISCFIFQSSYRSRTVSDYSLVSSLDWSVLLLMKYSNTLPYSLFQQSTVFSFCISDGTLRDTSLTIKKLANIYEGINKSFTEKYKARKISLQCYALWKEFRRTRNE